MSAGFADAAAGTSSPSAVKETSERTVSTDVETQKAVDAWAAEEKALLEKIDQREHTLKRILWEQSKTAAYVSTLEDKMSELMEKAEEMKKINAELLPILDRGLKRLTAFVETDIPFDKSARLRRIQEATHTLNDYDAGLLAKTRTLFDQVAREVDFGYSMDVEETEIDIQGRSIRVKLLKVGRVGLFALSMDAEKAYVWDAVQEKYVPLKGGVREIDEAIQIAEQIHIIELIRLPMGSPKTLPEAGDGHHE